MKSLRFVIMLLMALSFACCADKPDSPTPDGPNGSTENQPNPHFQIYLCFGQSNMEGNAAIEDIDREDISGRFLNMVVTTEDSAYYGKRTGTWRSAVPPLCRKTTGLTPADYFGREMLRHVNKSDTIGIVMVAIGGAAIEAFDKDQCEAYYNNGSTADWLRAYMNHYDRNPYQKLVEMAKKAQRKGVIKGILLHQGESNNGQQDWPDKVKKIYNDLLTDLDLTADDVPLLVGETLRTKEGGVCGGHNSVIAKLPNVIPTAHVVSSEGCPGCDDGLHFTAEGYRIIGKRYAQTMLKISGYTNTEYAGIHTDGRFLKDANGQIVNLHGFAQTYSPWFNEQMTKWNNYDVDACLSYNQGLIDDIQRAGWAMDFVRMHMDPYWSNTPGVQTTGENDISAFDVKRFKQYLDEVFVPMAKYIIKSGMYVVMRPPGVCPHVIAVGDDYNKYLIRVWDIVSQNSYLKNNPMVMFELANEPVDIKGKDGSTGSWSQSHFDACKEIFQSVVDVIRGNGCDNVLWVPGPAYQGNYSGFANNPVEGYNIGYAVHVYPGWLGSDGENPDHGDIQDNGGYESFQTGWNEKVKPVADFAPVMVTEMDWAPAKYNKSWGKAYTGVAGGAGFGANFKLIADLSGNVSWLIFTSPDLLAQFNDKAPASEADYTFLSDPEACPWPVYHWYKEYAEGEIPKGEPMSVNIGNAKNGKVEMMLSSTSRLVVSVMYSNGTASVVSENLEFVIADSSVVSYEGGRFKAQKEGATTIEVKYSEAGKTLTKTIEIEVLQFFPLTNAKFDPNIWETGSFDETTGTLITGQWGFGGWKYPSGINLSGYSTLTIELGAVQECSASFRLFDSNNYWSDPAMYDFGTKTTLTIDLQNMKNKNGQKVDAAHIYIAGIWTSGGKPVVIKSLTLE